MIDWHVFLGLGAGPVAAGGRSGAAALGVAASAGPGWRSCREARALGRRRVQGLQDKEDRITMERSSGNAFFANFSSYDAPFPTKIRLALANNWRKVRTRSDCCGNYGEPGC